MHNKPGPTDTIPAWLSPGEAVLNKEASELLGRDTIKALNHKGLAMRKGIVPVQGFEDGTNNVQPVTQAQAAADFAKRTGYTPGTALGVAPAPAQASSTPSSSAAMATSSLPSNVQKSGTSYSAAKPEGTGSISSDPRYMKGAQITRLDGTTGTGGPGYTDSIKPDTSAPKSNLSSGSNYYQSRAQDLGLMSTEDVNKNNFANQSTGITTLGGGANLQSLANTGAGALGTGGIMRSMGVGNDIAKPIKPMNGQQAWNQQQNETSARKSLMDNLQGSVVDWDKAPGFQEGTEKIGKDLYPTKNATPVQQSIEKATGVVGRTEGKSIPMSASQAQAQQIVKDAPFDFMGKQNEKGIFKSRPVKPGTALVPVEGTYQSTPRKASFEFKPGQGTPGAGTAKAGGFTLGEGPATAPKIDPYTGEPIKPGAFKESLKSAVGPATSAGKGVLGKAYTLGKNIVTAPENLAMAAEEWNRARVEKLATAPERSVMQNVELAARAPVYAATRMNPIELAYANKAQEEQKANTALPEGAPLKGGATVGGKEPTIDFSNPSVSDIVGEKLTPEDYRKRQQPQTAESAPQASDKIMEAWNADQARVKAEKEQAPQRAAEMAAVEVAPQRGLERGVSDFWRNMGYEGGASQYRADREQRAQRAIEQAQMNALMEAALSGPSGDMSPAEFGAAKRRQKMAQGILGDIQKAQSDRERTQASIREAASRREEAALARDEARQWKEADAARQSEWRKEDMQAAMEKEKRDEARLLATEERKTKSQAELEKEKQANKWYTTPDGMVQGKDMPEVMRKKMEQNVRQSVDGYIKKEGDSVDDYVNAIIRADAPEAATLRTYKTVLSDPKYKLTDEERSGLLTEMESLIAPYRSQ